MCQRWTTRVTKCQGLRTPTWRGSSRTRLRSSLRLRLDHSDFHGDSMRGAGASMVIVLVVCLAALTVSCGADEDNTVETVGQTGPDSKSNDDDELVEASPWSDLIDTTWEITAMAGFTADRHADATFSFRVDRFGYFDGVNWKGSEIVWTDSGFTVTQTGDSTSMGAEEGNERYLHELVEAGVQVEVTRNLDGTLTLTQGNRTVTAERIA